MRISVVTQEGPFYLPPALDQLCSARHGDFVALIVLPAFDEKPWASAKRLYHFYGPYDFLRLVCRFAWTQVADRINRVRAITRPYSPSDVARRHGIPLYQPAKINSPEFVITLRDEIRPDLLVSISASQILRKRVLDIPPLGCINLHSAPLPHYQGMMPNFWTLVHNEPEAAVTVHYMVEKLDAGDIILQKRVQIYPSDSLHDLIVRSKQIGVQTVLEAIQQIESGTAKTKPIDSDNTSYFSFPTRADAKRLRAQGRKLL